MIHMHFAKIFEVNTIINIHGKPKFKELKGLFLVHIVREEVSIYVTLSANASLSSFSGYYIKIM